MHWKLYQFGKKIYFKRFHNGNRNIFLNTSDRKCFFLKMWPELVHAGWKFVYYKTTNHRQATVNRPPTQRQVVHRQSTTDSLTGSPQPNDHWPPTHRQFLHQHTDSPTGPPPTDPMIHQQDQTYYNRCWLLVVGDLSLVGGFVIRPENFKEYWNQVSLSF